MNHPAEFFEKRSFEVVHAAFRVAAVVTRPAVREMLEERALEYFDYKDSVSLNALREAVDLGAKIGEITEVNAQVLLREINTLMDAAREREEEEEKMYSGMGEHRENVSLDGMFSKPPVSFSDFMNHDDSMEGNAAVSDISPTVGEHVVLRDLEDQSAESGKEFSDLHFEKRIKPIVSDSNHISGKSPEKSPEMSGSVSFQKEKQVGQTHQAAERREFIVSFLRNKTFCHVNDIIEQLPQVTDRTIRYDIKALVDSKIVERVGNGGPNSYFRLKRGSTQM